MFQVYCFPSFVIYTLSYHLLLFACASIFYICACVCLGVVINLVPHASIYSVYSLVLFEGA